MSYYNIELQNVRLDTGPDVLPEETANEYVFYEQQYQPPEYGYKSKKGSTLDALSVFSVPAAAVGGFARFMAKFMFYLFTWFLSTFGVYLLWAAIFIYVFWYPILYVYRVVVAVDEYQRNLRAAIGELTLSSGVTELIQNLGKVFVAIFPFVGFEVQHIQDNSIPDDACQCSWLNINLESGNRKILQWLPEMTKKLCAVEEDDGRIHVGQKFDRRCQYTDPDSGLVVQYPRNNLRGTENRGIFFLSGKSLGENLPGTCRPVVNRYTPATGLRNYKDIGQGRGICFTYDYVGKATYDLSGSIVLSNPGTLICRDDATGDVINNYSSCTAVGTTLECWDGTAPLGSYLFKKSPEKNDFLYIEDNTSVCNVGVPFLP
jgi:hypothetical protein